MLDSRLNQSLYVLQPGQVSRDGQNFDTGGGPYFSGSRLQLLHVAAADDEVRPLLGQRIRAGPAQTLAAATNDGHSASDSEVHKAPSNRKLALCYQHAGKVAT